MRLFKGIILSSIGLIIFCGCSASQYYAAVPPPPQPVVAPEIKEPAVEQEIEEAESSPEPVENIQPEETPKVEPPAVSQKNVELPQAEVPVPQKPAPPQTAAEKPQATKEAPPPPTAPKKTPQTLLDEALDFCQVSQELWQKGELENAIEALDQAYYLILQVETYDDPKLTQQREDLRFLISKRILEIYASRNIVVNGEHHPIPMDMNDHIQRELNLFTKGVERKFFQYSYKRSGRYRQKIVQALKEAGLPEELSWLPLIESGYKANALSRARALGLWQFIPSTGYKFGLKRNLYIDERLDPEKSTHAAIAYLKELHQIFGDWATVLAAYNCGEGRVLRVIRNQNVNYLDNFWDLYQRLPLETARYVPRFLATLHIIKNPQKFGLEDVAPDAPYEFETVSIKKQIRLKDIAKKINVNAKTLQMLNPELRRSLLPPEKYDLKVPVGTSSALLAELDKISVYQPPRMGYVYHQIRPGETLSTIARRYRVSMRSLVLANSITRKHLIVAGKKLKIPHKGYKIQQIIETKPAAVRPSPLKSRHVVKSGDSLWIIARRYGTTVKEIRDLNNLKDIKLSINQELKIPGAEKKKTSAGKLESYYVKQGDSPYTIARRFGIPLQHFLKINHLTPRSKIFPGQKMYVD